MEIDRTQVMPLLVAACPSFGQFWEDYVRGPEYDELLYLHLGEFARHLLSLYQSGDTSEFSAVFQVVEDMHVRGDSYVREAATIGLLESLQNNAEHRDLEPAVFQRFLGPETGKWWERLTRFWRGDGTALRE